MLCWRPNNFYALRFSCYVDMTIYNSLQMARTLYTNSERTIGFITNIDIMDRGINANSMIITSEGLIGIVWISLKNRAQ